SRGANQPCHLPGSQGCFAPLDGGSQSLGLQPNQEESTLMSMENIRRYKATVGDRELFFETGHLAMQAGGAVTVREGETMVLATATMSSRPREGIDFLPLSVDFEERLYAVGRIPGSWFRREGRP